MEYISTTALAAELDMKSSDLFEKLKSVNWIERKNDKWVLTDLGKMKGGQLRSNPKFGEYIVWPQSIDILTSLLYEKVKLLNATAIGKHFEVSSQRLNLILSELGLIEKDLGGGWVITKMGKQVGGKQFEHETSGANYVLWPESILEYHRLLEIFGYIDFDQDQLNSDYSKKIESTDLIENKHSFREKFEAKHRTFDGHFVRSKAEMLIDNWLYHYGIIHAYERKLPVEEEAYCDFYIPSGNGRPQAVYIEYWGLENDPKYAERKKAKIEIYKNNDLSLIEISDSEILNLDDVLAKKLRQFKITVG